MNTHWILTDPVKMTKVTDLEYRAERIGRPTDNITIDFGAPSGELYFNGKPFIFDNDNDYHSVINMADEVASAPNGAAIFDGDTVRPL
jgi:hypothetical protein